MVYHFPSMWTKENRPLYDRSHLRYESDLTDAEWALVAPLIPPAKHGGAHRSVDVRKVVNGLMYILSTSCQWRAIPKDLPPRSTLHDYLDRWNCDGTLERIHYPKSGSWVIAAAGRIGGICGHGHARMGHHHSPG